MSTVCDDKNEAVALQWNTAALHAVITLLALLNKEMINLSSQTALGH